MREQCVDRSAAVVAAQCSQERHELREERRLGRRRRCTVFAAFSRKILKPDTLPTRTEVLLKGIVALQRRSVWRACVIWLQSSAVRFADVMTTRIKSSKYSSINCACIDQYRTSLDGFFGCKYCSRLFTRKSPAFAHTPLRSRRCTARRHLRLIRTDSDSIRQFLTMSKSVFAATCDSTKASSSTYVDSSADRSDCTSIHSATQCRRRRSSLGTEYSTPRTSLAKETARALPAGATASSSFTTNPSPL
jgi:hypothetical protein